MPLARPQGGVEKKGAHDCGLTDASGRGSTDEDACGFSGGGG